LSEVEIRAIATTNYAGKEAIASAKFIIEIPGEICGRESPL
jgi:hypothetical protein